MARSAALSAWGRASPPVRLGLVAGLLAVAWSLLVLDPLGATTMDPDAASSVLYFDRIAGGHRLEAFVPTTPKPLLTVLYGLTWAFLHDWRALTWETIAAWGVAVAATVAFVARVAAGVGSKRRVATALGSVAAGAFAAAALLGSSDAMLEVSRANSLVWALAGWAIAGLAVTSVPVRPRLAGLALLFAGLCRFETFALIAVVVVVAWMRRDPGRTAGAFIALAAVPLVMLHDWLLTGDPIYWYSVPETYTAIYVPGLSSIGPLEYAGTFAARLAAEWPIVILATLGVIALARARRWLPIAGIASIGLGVTALLFWLAFRATYISNRYYEPIDLALTVAAAVGLGWLVAHAAAGVAVQRRAFVPVAAATGLVVGAGVLWPALPWDRRATTELNDVRTASVHAVEIATVVDRERTSFQPEPLPIGKIASPFPHPPRSFGVLVPSRDVSRFSVELDMRLDVIGDLYAAVVAGAPDGLRAGQWIVHDGAADRPARLFSVFEIDAAVGRLAPAIAVPPGGRYWIDKVTE